MKRTIVMMAALTFSLALFASLAQATMIGERPVVQDPAKEEADAYAAWYTAYKAQDAEKTLELGKAFVQKFPNSKYADFVKKDFSREYGILFNKNVQSKNIAELIRIGKEYLAGDPDNLDYLLALVVQIRTNEMAATPPNFSHAADATDFAERSIKLIEAGKTAGDPKVFKAKITIGYMHETLAMIYDHDKNLDKALAEYDKAAEAEPTNSTYFFHCGRIHNAKYAAAAQKYQAMPEADRDAADPKPEVKSALDEVNKQADAVITCWARFLGLTVDNKGVKQEVRAQIEKALTDLYKYRHNDSTEGLQKLIDQNRTTPPTGASGNSVSATTKQP